MTARESLSALNVSQLAEHAEGLRLNAAIFRDLDQRSREAQLYNAATALNEAADEINRLRSLQGECPSGTTSNPEHSSRGKSGESPALLPSNECVHEFRPFDSSGQLACIHCNARDLQELAPTKGQDRAPGSGNLPIETALMVLCAVRNEFGSIMSSGLRKDIHFAIELLRRPAPETNGDRRYEEDYTIAELASLCRRKDRHIARIESEQQARAAGETRDERKVLYVRPCDLHGHVPLCDEKTGGGPCVPVIPCGSDSRPVVAPTAATERAAAGPADLEAGTTHPPRSPSKTKERRPHVDERVPGCDCAGCEVI